jgi:rubrerythrin
MGRDVLDALHAARHAEKEQALYYRALALKAEEADDAVTAERLNGLHADEQHHLSRLTARLLELDQSMQDLPSAAPARVSLDDWETGARQREKNEIARYESLLRLGVDAKTGTMIREFLDAERRHESELGGKWMAA